MPDDNKNEIESEDEEQEAQTRFEQARRFAIQQTKAKAKKVVVDKVKKAIFKKIITFLFTTPAGWWVLGVTLGIILLAAIIFVIAALIGYFQENPCEATRILGDATGNIIIKAIGAVCGGGE